jgi:hypothetical protein
MKYTVSNFSAPHARKHKTITDKIRNKYRKKVKATRGNYTRTKPLMRLIERHPWVFRHSSKRFWVEALSFVAGVIALTIWVSVMLG